MYHSGLWMTSRAPPRPKAHHFFSFSNGALPAVKQNETSGEKFVS
jgi:hypothetical protein